MSIAVRFASSRSVSARSRRILSGAVVALAVVAAACARDVSPTGAPSLAKQNTVAGNYELVAVGEANQILSPGTTPLSVPVCNGSATLKGATLSLESNGSFVLILSLVDAQTQSPQTYQEKGTYKVQGSSITFRSSGASVTGELQERGELQGSNIYIPSYTYCGDTHSLLFAPSTFTIAAA